MGGYLHARSRLHAWHVAWIGFGKYISSHPRDIQITQSAGWLIPARTAQENPSKMTTLSLKYMEIRLRLALRLLLDRRELELLAQAILEGLPLPEIGVLVPRKDAHPRLHVVVQPQYDVVLLGHLARRVRDLVLGALVLEGKFPAA